MGCPCKENFDGLTFFTSPFRLTVLPNFFASLFHHTFSPHFFVSFLLPTNRIHLRPSRQINSHCGWRGRRRRQNSSFFAKSAKKQKASFRKKVSTASLICLTLSHHFNFHRTFSPHFFSPYFFFYLFRLIFAVC